MKRGLIVAVIALVVIVAIVMFTRTRKTDDEQLKREQAQLEQIAEIQDSTLKIERYEELLREGPSAGTRRTAARSIVRTYLYNMKDVEKARSRAEELLAAEKDLDVRTSVYYTLFDYYAQNDMPQAVELCDTLLNRGGESGSLYNAMGWTFLERDTLLDLATQLCAKAVERAEDNETKAGAYDSMGWIKYKQGDYPEAVKNLESAKQLQAEPDAEVLFHLAQAYVKVDRKDEAMDLGIQLLSRSMDPEVKGFVEGLYKEKHGSVEGLDNLIREKRLAASSEAPDFTLTDLNGQSRSLSSYRGKVVVLNFWSPT